MTEGGTEGCLPRRRRHQRKSDTVELRGVGFTYDEGCPGAGSDVNLVLKRGQRVAVVGEVGSGKSTLLKIAAGMLSAHCR